MGRQWKRLLNLTVGNTTIVSSGDDVSAGLRVQFKIRKQELGTPNVAHITVTNLSDQTAIAMQSASTTSETETPVMLTAGYIDSSGLIFTGTMNQYIKGRESPTDKTFQIFARDSGKTSDGLTQGVISKAIAKGSTPMDHFNAFAEALKPYGITKGYAPSELLSKLKYPRGVSFFGMVKDHIRDLALSNGCTWSIQDGALQMVPVNGSLPGNPYVLNSATGLIGIPTQTTEGIMIRCLINPNIKIKGQVKVDQKDIQQAAQSQAYAGDVANSKIPGLATDGIYTVEYLEITGDTRGVPWYMDLTCSGSGYFPAHHYVGAN